MSDPAAIIRKEREARGLRRQRDLAELLGVTQPFVSQIERGLVDLPGEEVRAKFLEHWGLDPFAERAAKREGKISASEFSRRKKIDIHSILRLIAEDLLPAHFLGNGLGYELDEEQALAALKKLDRCRYEGCDEPATSETGCCGEHAQRQWALEARGTKRPADECDRIREGRVRCDNAAWRGRIAAAKRGKPRPDVRVRVAAMHADREQHYRWGVRLAEGRAASTHPLNRPYLPNSMRRWKGRLGGLEAGRLGGRERGYSDEKIRQVRGLKQLDPNIGRHRIAKLAGLTEKQVRAILAEIEG
jgi:transcriptional regulator with XRE-family HTH domain